MEQEDQSGPAWSRSSGLALTYVAVLYGLYFTGKWLGWPSDLPLILPAVLLVALLWKVFDADDGTKLPTYRRDPFVGLTVLQWGLLGFLGFAVLSVLVDVGFLASGFLSGFIIIVFVMVCVAYSRGNG